MSSQFEPTATANGIRLQWDRSQFRRRSSDTRGNPIPSTDDDDRNNATATARQAGHDMGQAFRQQQPLPASSNGDRSRGIQYSGRRSTPMNGTRSKSQARAPPAPERRGVTSSRSSTQKKSSVHRVQEVDSLVPERSWNDDTKTSGLFDPTIKGNYLFSEKREKRKSETSHGGGAPNSGRTASGGGQSKRKNQHPRDSPPRRTGLTNRDRRADRPTNPWKRYQELMGMNKQAQTKRKKPKKQSRKKSINSSINHVDEQPNRRSQHVAFENTQDYVAPKSHSVRDQSVPQSGHAAHPDESVEAPAPKEEVRSPRDRARDGLPSNRIFSRRKEQRKVISIPDVTEHVHHVAIDEGQGVKSSPQVTPETEGHAYHKSTDPSPEEHTVERGEHNLSFANREQHGKENTTGKSKRSRGSKRSANKSSLTYKGPASRLSSGVRDSQQLREMLWSLSEAQNEEEQIAARQLQRTEYTRNEGDVGVSNTRVPLGVIEGAGESIDFRNEYQTGNVNEAFSTGYSGSSEKMQPVHLENKNSAVPTQVVPSNHNSPRRSSVLAHQPPLHNVEEIKQYGRKTRKRQQLRYALLEGTGINEFEMHKTLADRLTKELVREACEEIDEYINSIAEDTAYAV